MIGISETAPVNINEFMIMCAIMIISAFLNSQIFGEIAVMVQILRQNQINYQRRIDTSNSVMQNLRLPDDLQKDIREFLIKTEKMRIRQMEFANFFQQLSPIFRQRIQFDIFSNVQRLNYVVD